MRVAGLIVLVFLGVAVPAAHADAPCPAKRILLANGPVVAARDGKGVIACQRPSGTRRRLPVVRALHASGPFLAYRQGGELRVLHVGKGIIRTMGPSTSFIDMIPSGTVVYGEGDKLLVWRAGMDQPTPLATEIDVRGAALAGDGSIYWRDAGGTPQGTPGDETPIDVRTPSEPVSTAGCRGRPIIVAGRIRIVRATDRTAMACLGRRRFDLGSAYDFAAGGRFLTYQRVTGQDASNLRRLDLRTGKDRRLGQGDFRTSFTQVGVTADGTTAWLETGFEVHYLWLARGVASPPTTVDSAIVGLPDESRQPVPESYALSADGTALWRLRDGSITSSPP